MKLLTLNEIAALDEEVLSKIEALTDELLEISDLEQRKLKMENGLYARLNDAMSWMHMIDRSVKIDRDLAAINLPDSVSVALFDAYILPK